MSMVQILYDTNVKAEISHEMFQKYSGVIPVAALGLAELDRLNGDRPVYITHNEKVDLAGIIVQGVESTTGFEPGREYSIKVARIPYGEEGHNSPGNISNSGFVEYHQKP